MDEHIEDDTLCRPDVDPIVVKRSVVCHVADETMSSFFSAFKETDDLFFEFGDEYNNARGSSSMGDNLDEPQLSLTPRICQQSRNLELERYVHKHGKISITIATRAEKPISSYVVRFNNTIDECERYICSPLAALSGLMLDENTLRWSMALYRLVEHQMLTSFKEFRDNYHRHFKKYNDHE
ncbi:CACTA en-spm transposon protein [Cucumis melo var. makuwa]|uniref:CACTA en-spm transposon protein n=1 Tax=Cucumis melo var. makuwa TaxID=1194695 RepID=A0A5A7UC41_CUCMM|nr:CACTA en-spm transposon protein [Cucumis melo var. makuwa]TYK02680.1 CACTA en-spm transposon protein [Cucumis melo var. makuwa]